MDMSGGFTSGTAGISFKKLCKASFAQVRSPTLKTIGQEIEEKRQ